MTNAQILELERQLDGFTTVQRAASPTVPTTSTFTAGEFMNRTQVNALIDLTTNSSEWLKLVTLLKRSQKKGEIPREILNEVVTEGVAENAMATVPTHPDVSHIAFETAKFQATTYMTLESLREARASGTADFAQKVLGAFAKAIGNDMARWTMRGDTTLDASTRLNRLLRQRDGWLKQIRANGVRLQTTRGSAYNQALYWQMSDNMPEEYGEDPALKWLIPRALDMAFQEDVSGYAAQGSQIGDKSLTERRRWSPIGIDPIIVPQMPTDQGLDTVTAAAADADSISGAGSIVTATLSTWFGGYAAGNAGRKVRITCIATGDSEICTVYNDGGANKAATVGTLGQGTISTTPADYVVDLADLASVILTNPKNLFIVMCDQVRAYRKFEQEGERFRIDLYYEATCGLFNENAVVIQDGVIRPAFTFGS